MQVRLAAIAGGLSFALCLLLGEFAAGNPFSTNVLRALMGMGGTFVVGLLIGSAAQKLLNEGAAALETGKSEKKNAGVEDR